MSIRFCILAVLFLYPLLLISQELKDVGFPVTETAAGWGIRLGIVEFSAIKKEESGLAYLIYNFFLESLMTDPRFKVISSDSMKELTKKDEPCLTEDIECLSYIGEKSGADLILSGLVTRKGNLVHLELRVFSTPKRDFILRLDRLFSPGDEGSIISQLVSALEKEAIPLFEPTGRSKVEKPAGQVAEIPEEHKDKGITGGRMDETVIRGGGAGEKVGDKPSVMEEGKKGAKIALSLLSEEKGAVEEKIGEGTDREKTEIEPSAPPAEEKAKGEFPIQVVEEKGAQGEKMAEEGVVPPDAQTHEEEEISGVQSEEEVIEEDIPESMISDTFKPLDREDLVEEEGKEIKTDESIQRSGWRGDEYLDLGISRYEFWFFKKSRMNINEWHIRAKKRKGKFGAALYGGWAGGLLNMRFLSIEAFSEGFIEVIDDYTFEILESSNRSGGFGGSISYYFSNLLGVNLDAGILSGILSTKREWVIEPSKDGNIGETDYDSTSIIHWYIHSGMDFFLIPYGRVKPFIAGGLTMIIFPAIEDVYPHKGQETGIGVGVTTGGGLFVDMDRDISIFVRIPFTYLFDETISYLNRTDSGYIDDAFKEEAEGGSPWVLSFFIGLQKRFDPTGTKERMIPP